MFRMSKSCFAVAIVAFFAFGCKGNASRDRDAYLNEIPDVPAEVSNGEDCFQGSVIVDDIGWVGLPFVCQNVHYDYAEMVRCGEEFFNQICGLDEANRLLELGQCPPKDRSVISPSERLILGGDPKNKTTLPEGAQCPQGFERLPRVVRPNEQCTFQPTCWEVGVATRIPEPAIIDGKYVLSGLDAIYLADPGAGFGVPEWVRWAEAKGMGLSPLDTLPRHCEGPKEGWKCKGCETFEDPWPTFALKATPAPEVKDGKMKICAAEGGPWVDMEQRDVVAQFGGFFVPVIIKNFRTSEGCVIPNLRLISYCCGPILMLWPEELEELRTTLGPICVEKQKKHIEECKEHQYETCPEPSFWVHAVAPRTEGLRFLLAYTSEQGFSVDLGASCIEQEGCQPCAANACNNGNDRWCIYKKLGSYNIDEFSSEQVMAAEKECALSGVDFAGVSLGDELELTLDESGAPVAVSKRYPHSCVPDYCHLTWVCEYDVISVPYRTPEEVATEIPAF